MIFRGPFWPKPFCDSSTSGCGVEWWCLSVLQAHVAMGVWRRRKSYEWETWAERCCKGKPPGSKSPVIFCAVVSSRHFLWHFRGLESVSGGHTFIFYQGKVPVAFHTAAGSLIFKSLRRRILFFSQSSTMACVDEGCSEAAVYAGVHVPSSFTVCASLQSCV